MRQFFLQNDTKQRINSQIKEISTLTINSLETLITNAFKVTQNFSRFSLYTRLSQSFTSQEKEIYISLCENLKNTLFHQFAIKEIANELPALKRLSDTIKNQLAQVKQMNLSKESIKEFIVPLYQMNDLAEAGRGALQARR